MIRRTTASLLLALLLGCNADRVGASGGEDELTNEEICMDWCDHMFACGILGPENDSCHDDCMNSYLTVECEPGQREYLMCVADGACDVTEVPAAEGACADPFESSCGENQGN